jgi:CYTH domain-containing protein
LNDGNQEIEHKFLVKRKKLPPLPLGKKIKQGYLSRSPVVRVRIIDDRHAYLTVKGSGCRVRDEFEYPIPAGDAKRLMKLCGKRKIVKNRYVIDGWEIDEFKGRHKGLWLAEIELPSVSSSLPDLPEWVGKEVTYNPKYSNASLADRK